MKMQQKYVSVAVVLATASFLAACGGSSSPSSPSPGGTTPSANVTVNIIGNAGAQSFNPNPVSVPVGQTLAFRNSTGETHRIVQDGGGFDSGNIAPGATSSLVAGGTTSLITVSSGSAMTFHCTLHPSMVGSINGAVSGGGGSGDPDPGSGGGSGSGDGY
jgi:plastocyanin